MAFAHSLVLVLIASFCTSAFAQTYVGLRVLRSEQEANSLGRVGDIYTVDDTSLQLNAYAGYGFKNLALEVGGGPLGRRTSHNVSSTFDIHQDIRTTHLYAGLLPKIRIQQVDVHAMLAVSRVWMKSHEFGSNENGPNQENFTEATDTSPMLGLGLTYARGKWAVRFDFFRINNVARSIHTNSSDVIVYAVGVHCEF